MAKAVRQQKYSYVDEWKSLWEPDLEAIGYNGITTDPTKVSPQVLQWVKDNCRNQPHFVKVISPIAAHGRPGLTSRNSTFLNLPIPFVRDHYKKLARVVTLESEDGRTWKVSLGSKPNRSPAWTQGWARVAKDNNLKPEDVVVFVLVRKSHFQFTLFADEGDGKSGADAVEKGEPSSSSHTQLVTRRSNNRGDELLEIRRRLLDFGSSPSRATEAQPSLQHEGESFESGESPATKPSTEKLETDSRSAGASNTHQSSRELAVPIHSATPTCDPSAVSIKSRRRVTTAHEQQTAEEASMENAKSLTAPHSDL